MRLKQRLAHLFHPRRSNNHRSFLLHPESVAYLTLIVLGFFLFVQTIVTTDDNLSQVLGYASNISAEQVVSQTNIRRTGSGVAPLTVNGQLNQAALAKGQDMFTNQYWAHTSPSGKEPWAFIREAGYSYTVAGENLARDFDSTPPMVEAWMNSATHRANIMNPRYSETGIAVINGVLQGVETTLVVQMFGNPTSSEPPPGAELVGEVAASTEELGVEEIEKFEEVETEESFAKPDPTPLDLPSISETDVLPSEIPAPTLPENAGGPVVEEVLVSDQPIINTEISFGGLRPTIVLSPLQLSKAFFLAVVLLVLFTLTYDFFIMGHRRAARLVGKNLAHILLFITVAALIIFFKAGAIL